MAGSQWRWAGESNSSLARSLLSVLSLPLRYPSVDFMPMKIEAVAQLERKRNVAATEQPVNRAVRDLQILSQVANSHQMTGSPGSAV